MNTHATAASTRLGKCAGVRKRILFVDDEAQVLAGLQDLMRRHRREWDMVFARGGEVALDELAKASFDVVVADLRMPGMDGADLLRHVRQDHPNTARIVLSGYADREVMVRALPVAHQFLSKPCDADQLRLVIDRTCGLQALLGDTQIRMLVGKLDKLPARSESHLALTEAVLKVDGALGAVARVVERDPAMSAKVLQLVNSGYFGLGRRVTSVQRAVEYLGIDLIRELTLNADVFATIQVPSVAGLRLDDVQEHSFMTAKVARRLVTDPARAEEAFAAAIVHDVGRLILALVLPEAFAEVLRVARDESRAAADVERERLGVTHAEVGAYLLGAWGLPMSIVEAVAYHNAPGRSGAADREILAAVHAADALIASSTYTRPHEDLLDSAFLESAGLIGHVSEWRARVDDELRGMASPR